MIFGLIHAYECAHEIAAAVDSLRAGGCDRVVVIDGAWTNPDGGYFGGGRFVSVDGTADVARGAGAEVIVPPEQSWDDGGKRDWSLRNCGARDGDYLLLLDADEILVGRVDRDTAPSPYGCIVHRDLHPNDLGAGGVWPRGDYGPEKPLLRWIRWSDDISCEKPGVYHDAAGRVHAYLVGAMAERAAGRHDPLFAHAHRAIRDLEEHLPAERASLLPILQGVEIHHDSQPSAERVAAKERYYAQAVAA